MESCSTKIMNYDSRSTANGLLDRGSTPLYSILITPRSVPKGDAFMLFKDTKMRSDMNYYYHDGFTFLTKEEAALAEVESKRVAYIEERLDYTNPLKVLSIYNKAIDEHVFEGQVGLSYLRKIQEFLMHSNGIDANQIQAIPAFDVAKQVKSEPAKKAKPEKSQQLIFSVIMNIALVAAIIAMFAITLTSDNPNILNYERTLQNKYATWEQELKSRESKVREKERELGIPLYEEESEFEEENFTINGND